MKLQELHQERAVDQQAQQAPQQRLELRNFEGTLFSFRNGLASMEHMRIRTEERVSGLVHRQTQQLSNSATEQFSN